MSQPIATEVPRAAAPTHTDYTQVDAAAYAAHTAAHAAAATPPPAAVPVEAPPPPTGQALADMRAEVAAEDDRADAAEDPVREYPDGAVAVELEGSDGRRGVVHILEPNDWPSDANSALHVGDFESWADGCLALDDYDRIWSDLRPTLRAVNEMFARYRELTGQDTGKSPRSPRALRRAARK